MDDKYRKDYQKFLDELSTVGNTTDENTDIPLTPPLSSIPMQPEAQEAKTISPSQQDDETKTSEKLSADIPSVPPTV